MITALVANPPAGTRDGKAPFTPTQPTTARDPIDKRRDMIAAIIQACEAKIEEFETAQAVADEALQRNGFATDRDEGSAERQLFVKDKQTARTSAVKTQQFINQLRDCEQLSSPETVCEGSFVVLRGSDNAEECWLLLKGCDYVPEKLFRDVKVDDSRHGDVVVIGDCPMYNQLHGRSVGDVIKDGEDNPLKIISIC